MFAWNDYYTNVQFSGNIVFRQQETTLTPLRMYTSILTDRPTDRPTSIKSNINRWTNIRREDKQIFTFSLIYFLFLCSGISIFATVLTLIETGQLYIILIGSISHFKIFIMINVCRLNQCHTIYMKILWKKWTTIAAIYTSNELNQFQS